MRKPKPIPIKHQKVLKELIAASKAMNHAWELICELHAKYENLKDSKRSN